MSGLSILIHGVKSLPNAALCEKCFYDLHSSNFLASDKFCPLLMIFSNSLDPDQGRQNIGPDLDANCLTL